MENWCFVHEDISEESYKTDIRQKVCGDLPSEYNHNGNSYCVLHYPFGSKDLELFNIEVKKLLHKENCDFRGVYFPEKLELSNGNFDKSMNFDWATFSDEINFCKAVFDENSVVSFIGAEFRNTVVFREAILRGYIRFGIREPINNHDNGYKLCFEGEKARMDWRDCKIENANRISFNIVRLEPNWFVGTDARNFVFYECWWKDSKDSDINFRNEIEILKEIRVRNPLRSLQITCQQLVAYYENNNHYEWASKFRTLAWEIQFYDKAKRHKLRSYLINKNWMYDDRHPEFVPYNYNKIRREKKSEKQYSRIKGILEWSIDWLTRFTTINGLYRLTSYYGENIRRAFFVLGIMIFAIFPFIYTQTEFQVTPNNVPLGVVVNGCKDVIEELKPVCKIENRGLYFFSEAIPHSLANAALQNVEFRKPLTVWGELWIILEKIFAPLQAALLALAIRRKFMR